MKYLYNLLLASLVITLVILLNSRLLNATPQGANPMVLPVHKGHCRKVSKCQVGSVGHVRESNIAHFCDFRYQIVYLHDDRVHESEYFCVLRTVEKRRLRDIFK